MKYYVTSDVHGFYTPLIKALTEKGFFEDKSEHKLVICGDLFDRGKESVELQKFLLELMDKNELILVRGNHEDIFEDFLLKDKCFDAFGDYDENGTLRTAIQLSGYKKGTGGLTREKLCEALLETPYHKIIIPSMLNYYETEHYIFVHGWYPCKSSMYIHPRVKRYFPDPDWRNASEDQWKDARWYNGMDAAQDKAEEKTVFCGHRTASYGHAMYERRNPVIEGYDYTPYYGPGVIAVDACTVKSGFVNVVVVED